MRLKVVIFGVVCAALNMLRVGNAGAVECGASPATRADLAQLDTQFPRATDRIAALKKQLSSDPQNIGLHETLEDLLSEEDYRAALAADRAQLAAHPDAPLWSFLVARLVGYAQLKEAIPLYQAVLAKDAGWAVAHYELAAAYHTIKDREHTAAEVKAYAAACPDNVQADNAALYFLPTDTALLTARAAVLRTRLAQSREPLELLDYGTLWKLEFKVTPVSQHAQVRQRVSKDVVRIRAAANVPSERLLGVLKEGYTSTSDGAGKKWVAAELLSRFRGSVSSVYEEVGDWERAHPQPGEKATPAERAAWAAAFYAATEDWVKRAPAAAIGWRLSTAPPSLSPSEVGAMGARALALDPHNDGDVAPFYLSHGYQLKAALAMLTAARARDEHAWENRALQPDRFKFILKYRTAFHSGWGTEGYGAYLLKDAARLKSLVAQIAAARAADAKLPPDVADPHAEEATWWKVRGFLAAVERNRNDAIAFLLKARSLAPGDEDDTPTAPSVVAHHLWKEGGGSDEGWKLVAGADTLQPLAASSQTPWKKAETPLPTMALHDLRDRVWTTKDVSGKTIFYVAWATWCGPCKMELPLVQKLYEKTRDRKDMMVVSMNVDQDLGAVAPFMDSNKYSFPVLFASDYMRDLISEGIPFAMLADGKGVMRRSRVGFDPGDSSDNWLAEVLTSVGQIGAGPSATK